MDHLTPSSLTAERSGPDCLEDYMNDQELHAWVQAWAEHYPANDDDVLAPLDGTPELNRDQLAIVVNWKIERRWQQVIFKGLGKESDERIVDLTRRAFACNDDLGALLILQELHGIGAALASAILMVHDQRRYTVLDVWAIKSLVWLGELPRGSLVGSAVWSEYLERCRGIASRTGETLRVVDRALYEARGTAMPRERIGTRS